MDEVIICDDNVHFCDLVEKLLKKYEKKYEIDIIKFYDGKKLLDYCRENKFDVLVLDIELGEENGMDIARTLKSINPKCLIIYISSHDNYYIDMVQAEPFRFIYKDLSDVQVFENELDTAFSDAIKRLNGKKIFTYEFDRVQYTVDVDKIAYFFSSMHTIRICGETGEAPEYFYGKIDDLDNTLQKIGKAFVRVNKRYIINVNFVQQIRGNRQIVVANKTISLASGYRDNFIKSYFNREK